jgi:hypothetical protein
MPLGASSAAPVTSPGPNIWNKRFADQIIDPVREVTLFIMLAIVRAARWRSLSFRLVESCAVCFRSRAGRPRSHLNGSSETANDPQPGLS